MWITRNGSAAFPRPTPPSRKSGSCTGAPTNAASPAGFSTSSRTPISSRNSATARPATCAATTSRPSPRWRSGRGGRGQHRRLAQTGRRALPGAGLSGDGARGGRAGRHQLGRPCARRGGPGFSPRRRPPCAPRATRTRRGSRGAGARWPLCEAVAMPPGAFEYRRKRSVRFPAAVEYDPNHIMTKSILAICLAAHRLRWPVAVERVRGPGRSDRARHSSALTKSSFETVRAAIATGITTITVDYHHRYYHHRCTTGTTTTMTIVMPGSVTLRSSWCTQPERIDAGLPCGRRISTGSAAQTPPIYNRPHGDALRGEVRLTAAMSCSPKWKMLAASTASAFPRVSTSARCSSRPAPPLAITGMPTAPLTPPSARCRSRPWCRRRPCS